MKTAIVHAVIYVRFSPRPVKWDAAGNEIDVDSIEHQLDQCRAYCLARGYRIELEETDPFTSGGALGEMKRPGLHRALEALKPGWVLVCLCPDRLAKGVLVEEMIYQALAEAGAEVDFVQGGIPDQSLEAILGRRCLAAAIEYARLKNNEKTSDSMLGQMAKGKRVCGTKKLPYGWKLDVAGPQIVGVKGVARPSHMLPCPEEVAIVERILKMASEGKRPPSIKAVLEAEGILCRGRTKWHRCLIARIIQRSCGEA